MSPPEYGSHRPKPHKQNPKQNKHLAATKSAQIAIKKRANSPKKCPQAKDLRAETAIEGCRGGNQLLVAVDVVASLAVGCIRAECCFDLIEVA